MDVTKACTARSWGHGYQSQPVRSPVILVGVVTRPIVDKGYTEMNHDDAKRRTRMNDEGLKRRARRKDIPEDYDDDDFVDGYDYQEEDAVNLSDDANLS
jgi:hypothetical protein